MSHNSLQGQNWFLGAVYSFQPILNVPALQLSLTETAKALGVTGLIILGEEGLNGTCAAPSEVAFQTWQKFLQTTLGTDLKFKLARSEKPPFRQFKIKVRDEIVTAGLPGQVPPKGLNHHLSPQEWDDVLTQDPDAIVIDTRNWYEYKIGSFNRALNPDIEKFTEFPEWLEQQGFAKDRKMLIFCTGGIRCEKGILELQNKGYDNVYQLDGGILNYLEQRPNSQFWGECFVFDNRVAVDQNLQPSVTYSLCPHCGNPAQTERTCQRCDSPVILCEDCLPLPIKGETCSKHCAHLWEIKPGQKGRPQVFPQNSGLPTHFGK